MNSKNRDFKSCLSAQSKNEATVKIAILCKIYLGNKVTRQDPGLNYDIFDTEHSLYTNHTKDNRSHNYIDKQK